MYIQYIVMPAYNIEYQFNLQFVQWIGNWMAGSLQRFPATCTQAHKHTYALAVCFERILQFQLRHTALAPQTKSSRVQRNTFLPSDCECFWLQSVRGPCKVATWKKLKEVVCGWVVVCSWAYSLQATQGSCKGNSNQQHLRALLYSISCITMYITHTLVLVHIYTNR